MNSYQIPWRSQKESTSTLFQFTERSDTPKIFMYSRSLRNKRFEKDRRKEDFDTFLTNSPLFDPKEPIFESVCPFSDATRLDGLRLFKDEGVWPEYFGSYHIHHRIDGRLVAINVWDITPKTLGSIYTYYDPQFEFLSLGTFTAVREMEYMKRIREKYHEDMRYYYMGYYVQNCQKSVYKQHMHPQNLLCPFTYKYVPLTDEIKEKIDKLKYFKLAENEDDVDLFSMDKLLEFISDFKFVYQRTKWLEIHTVREESKAEFINNIGSIYKTIGDLVFTFLFEYQ